MGSNLKFLPVNKKDMEKRGWEELDVILVSGDAYVDHPSFAAGLLGRFLESRGYKVGIIAQPDWHSTKDFMALGKPRLFFGVTAGNLDSMVNHYTADKKKRSDDAYSPGGKAGLRPDRPTIVYTNRLRQAFPGVPVIIGGIEASLRRLAHYDYWDDKVRRSIFLDSKADLLVYGMGESALDKIARTLDKGFPLSDLYNEPGMTYASRTVPEEAVTLPSFEEVIGSKKAYAEACRLTYQELNPYSARPLAQQHGDRWVIQTPPPAPLTTRELDKIYELPFTRQSHPMYAAEGGVPALKTVQFSVVSHRGCFGGCSFCTLALHQGKFIQSRSPESILKEIKIIAQSPDFHGTITDIGGPSANMYALQGKKPEPCRKCQRHTCLSPQICPNLATSHQPSVELLEKARKIPGVKHVFVASGIRHDLVLADKSRRYLEELCGHHVSGQLKIAPEHVSPAVTGLMGKPGKETYQKFIEEYRRINEKLKRKQYLVSYFIAAHPGCGVNEMIELAEFVHHQLDYHPEQVQNFTPTPMSVSSCMYYTGINPFNGEKVFVPRTEKDRKIQRALLQYRDPKNRKLVIEALEKAGRPDLIKTLLRYQKPEKREENPKAPRKGPRRTRG